MSTASVITALHSFCQQNIPTITLESGQTFTLSYVKRSVADPLKYAGPYPYVAIRGGTYTAKVLTGANYQKRGLYHLTYVDRLMANTTSIDTLLDGADTFADALVAALNASYSNQTLNGAVFTVGEERGITVNLSQPRLSYDSYKHTLYAVEITIFVAEHPGP